MSPKYNLATGQLPSVHAAVMLLLVAFIVISLLLKRAFCSWLCPVGTLSELISDPDNKLFGRQFVLLRWLDIPLRGVRCLLLSSFLYTMLPMPARVIRRFMLSPYNMVMGVKMLDFFRRMGTAILISMITLLTISPFIRRAWCRCLYPYGVLTGVVSLLSSLRIRRNTENCTDCGKCTKGCPPRIPVGKLIQVRTVGCTDYTTCVESCPVVSASTLSLQRPAVDERAFVLSGQLMVLLTVEIMFTAIGYTIYAGIWQNPVLEGLYQRLIPQSPMIGYQTSNKRDITSYGVMLTKSHYFDFDTIAFKPGHFFSYDEANFRNFFPCILIQPGDFLHDKVGGFCFDLFF